MLSTYQVLLSKPFLVRREQIISQVSTIELSLFFWSVCYTQHNQVSDEQIAQWVGFSCVENEPLHGNETHCATSKKCVLKTHE